MKHSVINISKVAFHMYELSDMYTVLNDCMRDFVEISMDGSLIREEYTSVTGL